MDWGELREMSDENCCGACGYPIHATKESACDWCRQTADRIEALTAKLAEAVEGLREIAGFAEKEWVTPSGEAPPDVQNLCDIARTTLAEIEGEKG
jgi:hypothetical protein